MPEMEIGTEWPIHIYHKCTVNLNPHASHGKDQPEVAFYER